MYKIIKKNTSGIEIDINNIEPKKNIILLENKKDNQFVIKISCIIELNTISQINNNDYIILISNWSNKSQVINNIEVSNIVKVFKNKNNILYDFIIYNNNNDNILKIDIIDENNKCITTNLSLIIKIKKYILKSVY